MVNLSSKEKPEPVSNPTSLKYLFVALAILLAVTWTATYTITQSEERAALQSASLHSDRLAEFFERHANTTFQYADDYVKSVRRLFKRDKSLDAVRAFMAEVPPSSAILSHVTIMDAAGSPIFISTGREEKKFAPALMRETGLIINFKNQIRRIPFTFLMPERAAIRGS